MASSMERRPSFKVDDSDDNKRANSHPILKALKDDISHSMVKKASTAAVDPLHSTSSGLMSELRERTDYATAIPPSYFDSLPTEIVLLIIGHVADFWDRQRLRITNRRLYTLIPYPFPTSPPTHTDLLKLEQQLAQTIPIGCPQWLACGECLRLRPTSKLSPSTAYTDIGGMPVEFTTPWKICVDCGKQPLPKGYKLGDEKSTAQHREHYCPPGRWWMDEDGRTWVTCFVCWQDIEQP